MLRELLRISAICGITIICGCVTGRFQAGTDGFAVLQQSYKKYCIERIDFSVDVGLNTDYGGMGNESVNWPRANNMPWLAYKKDPEKFISGVMRQMPNVFSNAPDAERIILSCRITDAKHEDSNFPFLITWGFLFPMMESFEFGCNVSLAKRIEGNQYQPARYKTRLEYWVGEPWTLVCHFAYPPEDSRYSETCTFRWFNAINVKSTEEDIMYRTFAKAVLCAIERDVADSRPKTSIPTPASLDKLKSLRDSGVITQREFLEIIERISGQQQGVKP